MISVGLLGVITLLTIDRIRLRGGVPRAGQRMSAEAADAAGGAKGAGPGESASPSIASGIYALRTAPDRGAIALQRGASTESEKSVAAGLDWLARHQAADGHWTDEAKCEPDKHCTDFRYASAKVAQTGLAVLAFQAGGHYDFNDQKYSSQVKRGLNWLVSQQQPDGCLFGEERTWYEHGIASLALAEACAVARANRKDPERRYLEAAERAIDFIQRHQYARGGWRYSKDSDAAGDTSVTGWQVLALKSAMEAKIIVSPQTMEQVQQFFESVKDPTTGRTGYYSRRDGTELTTAVGLIVEGLILKQPKSPFADKAAAGLRSRAVSLGKAGDFYTLYNGSLAMALVGGDAWKEWNDGVRDSVIKRQETSGCARGSWDAARVCPYGRTLSTAWAILTLEVYYRYSMDGIQSGPSKPVRQ